jgi:radical SAM protein with 4Fe4S-binding SPASM domain
MNLAVSRGRIWQRVVAKLFRRIARHPWIGVRVAALEAEKWLFPLLWPRPEAGLGRGIRQVSFRITDLCNLRCHTCGQWGDQGFLRGLDLRDLKKNEVPLLRYQEVLTDLRRHGHRPLVYLWGGEPMLYDGVVDLMESATRLGMPVSVATNGTMVASMAPLLVKAPLFLLQLSVDGHHAGLHNQLRPGVGGLDNFAQIQAGLAAVQDARRSRGSFLPLIASLTVISRANFRHLVDIYEAFREQVDLLVFYLSWWIDPKNAQAHADDFQRRFGFVPTRQWGWVGDWKPDDFGELARQLRLLQARSRPWSAPPVIIIPPITAKADLETYYTRHQATFGLDRCISIFQVAEVNSNGDLSPCRDYHDYVVGNIKERTLSELWNSPAYREFRRSLATAGLMPTCSRCCGLMGY